MFIATPDTINDNITIDSLQGIIVIFLVIFAPLKIVYCSKEMNKSYHSYRIRFITFVQDHLGLLITSQIIYQIFLLILNVILLHIFTIFFTNLKFVVLVIQLYIGNKILMLFLFRKFICMPIIQIWHPQQTYSITNVMRYIIISTPRPLPFSINNSTIFLSFWNWRFYVAFVGWNWNLNGCIKNVTFKFGKGFWFF